MTEDSRPDEVSQFREACAHLSKNDSIMRLNASAGFVRWLLDQAQAHVVEYERPEVGGRAAVVFASVLGVSVSAVAYAGQPAYDLLVERMTSDRTRRRA